MGVEMPVFSTMCPYDQGGVHSFLFYGSYWFWGVRVHVIFFSEKWIFWLIVRQQVQEPLKTTRPPGYCWFSLTTTPRWNFREMSPDTLGKLEINTKIQDGGEAPDMVTLTFFLWEITSKFFLLAWGLWLLPMQQNYFKNRGRGILANSAIFRFFCGF